MARTASSTFLGALALVARPGAADDNGLALTPPMGWRSWNYHRCHISQEIMEASFRAMVDTSRLVDGQNMSLRDLGYVDAGLDDCWQACGSHGPHKYTYHDVHGRPQVDKSRFPSLAGMASLAHDLGLRAGFYSNNCHCSDHCHSDECYRHDVEAVLEWGFDSIKLDSCGRQLGTAKWRHLFNASSKPMMIEDCHNGPQPESRRHSDCPFHMYRTAPDIAPCWGSVLANLQTIVPKAEARLSYPGCWAYLDMLEVMQTNSQGRMPLLSAIESRSHFGLWAIVSSPLILGFDVRNAALVDAAWPFISNREVIDINQQWAGFSGSIFHSSEETTHFAPCGWWRSSCSFPSVQYLYKPQHGAKVAVLLLNSGSWARDLKLHFARVPHLRAAPRYLVRDVWQRTDLGIYEASYTASAVDSHDCAFLMITPLDSESAGAILT